MVVAFVAMVAAIGAYKQLRSWSLRRVSRKHGYVYREEDEQATVHARPLVGTGRLSEFVSGERAARKFVFCLWRWLGDGSTESERLRRGGLSAVVLVELRRPVPPVVIRPFGRSLPLEWKFEGPGLENPPQWISTTRFHVRHPDELGKLRELPRRLAQVMGGLKLRALTTDGRTMVWFRLDAPVIPSRIEKFLDEAQAAADALEEEGPGSFTAEALAKSSPA